MWYIVSVNLGQASLEFIIQFCLFLISQYEVIIELATSRTSLATIMVVWFQVFCMNAPLTLWHIIMALWHLNVFHITGPLWEESTSVPEKFSSERDVVMRSLYVAADLDTMALVWRHCNANSVCAVDASAHHLYHYGDVIMGAIATQISSLTVVYSTVYSDADQGKHQSSASLAFVWGIQRGPMNSQHKWSVTPKLFPFDDVIMI